MSRLNIASIVEGQGENSAVTLLLRNLWQYLGGEYWNALTPIRRSRGKLLKPGDPDLGKAIGLACLKLSANGGGLILILIDAEDDCLTKGSLGPAVLQRAKAIRGDADIACVIANVMYETWFVACAEALNEHLEIDANTVIPIDPEAQRVGKGWIKRHIRGAKYSETVDQPRLTSKMDFALCRRRSKSFDKLCRELELRIDPAYL